MSGFVTEQVELLKAKLAGKKVLCAMSGGVDSAVAAALVHRAAGDNLICVFVDHGLLRKGEAEEVVSVFRDGLGMNLIKADARELFLKKLAGVSDPERKRKIIGEEFIKVFEAEAKKDRRGRLPRAGNYLSRRGRERQGFFGSHQKPSQRGRPSLCRRFQGDHRASARSV